MITSSHIHPQGKESMSPLQTTIRSSWRIQIGTAITVGLFFLTFLGAGMKAKSDLEQTNALQDAEIRRLREDIAEIKSDVKTLLSRSVRP